MDANDNTLGDDTRRAFAVAAFASTAASTRRSSRGWSGLRPLPRFIDLALERTGEALRYGENPHQHGRAPHQRHDELVGRRARSTRPRAQLPQPLRRRRGVALRRTTSGPARGAIIKHANPCGVALADDLASAYQRALECASAHVRRHRRAQPPGRRRDRRADGRWPAGRPRHGAGLGAGHDRGADRQRRTRLLRAGPPRRRGSTSARSAAGSWCRTPHHFAATRDDWRVVTKRAPPTPSGATPSWRGASAVT